MDHNLSYPSSLPRSVCAISCQEFFPSPLPASLPPAGLGLPQGSLFNPSHHNTSSLARALPSPSNHPSAHPLPQPLPPPPTLGSPFVHQNSSPASYNMASGGIFSSVTGPSSANLAQQYHPLYSSYNIVPPALPTVAPFNPITSFAAMSQVSYQDNTIGEDPSSTTVFVAGLPPCITEDTLKTFFQNFGEIAYVKIPPHKGYGFVKYVRREDAKQAILKMNDFPIHEKSRIRLSWGRSLGDKKVEYVKKLSSALGISFESVWKIVQGQDPAAIKQIVTTVCGRPIGPTHEPPKLPVMTSLDQHHQTTRFPEFVPPAQTHISPPNVFPNVLSSQVSTSPTVIPHQKSLTELPVVATRNVDQRYLNDYASASDRKDDHHNRSIPSSKLNTSSLTNTRPKALSHGSGSASLPPPSWAMRNSWQGLFPNSKPIPQVESPVSSIDSNRLPEVSATRRATIPSVTPTSFASEHVCGTRRYPVGSPASAVFSSSQASSTDSLDALTPGTKTIAKDKIPTVKERDEYHLGFDGFLHELLEEEGREDVTLDPRSPTFCSSHRSSTLFSKASVRDLFASESSLSMQFHQHTENAKMDWPRTFLGQSLTSERDIVKSIFNSVPGDPSQTHPPHALDNSRNNNPTSNPSDAWSFQTHDCDADYVAKSRVDSACNTNPPTRLSPTPANEIKLLDNFWTLSL